MTKICRRQRCGRWLGGLVAVSLMLWASAATAQLRVDITRGTVEPLAIAVTDFLGSAGQAQQIGRDMSKVILADLERSGLFRGIDRRAFVNPEKSFDTLPQFGNWRVVKSQALAQGRVTIDGNARLKAEFRLWDVFAEQQMVGQVYTTIPSNWRQVAHIISDAIYKRITGEEGYFNTEIVYVAQSGKRTDPVKRLVVMDQDGENVRYLTDGSSIVLTPRFSPSRREITYMSYFGGVPRVYLFNFDNGKQEVLGNFPGMSFAPRFSPDGNHVIMSMAQDGNTEVYTMDLRTRQRQRLTRNSAIDTSPYYAPDGKRIVFNSDRSGSQQLYVMNSDGTGQKRISFGNGRYATPAWSPRGDMIAFTKITGGRFFIGVMTPEGKAERLLTEGFLVEGPTWAPNGRVLMFFRETIRGKDGKDTRLFTIDLTGHNERQVLTPGGENASDPAWSPLIR